ncbi:hypothetical protein HJ590_05565 [Naumannella sp. ID2617S]|nr:hypothetical protein [Naumannella sp. ID2617S]
MAKDEQPEDGPWPLWPGRDGATRSGPNPSGPSDPEPMEVRLREAEESRKRKQQSAEATRRRRNQRGQKGPLWWLVLATGAVLIALVLLGGYLADAPNRPAQTASSFARPAPVTPLAAERAPVAPSTRVTCCGSPNPGTPPPRSGGVNAAR